MTATLMGRVCGDERKGKSGPFARGLARDEADSSAHAGPTVEQKGRAGYRLSPAPAGAINSAVECVPYKDEVGGSNPSSPTLGRARRPEVRRKPFRSLPGRSLARWNAASMAQQGSLEGADARATAPAPTGLLHDLRHRRRRYRQLVGVLFVLWMTLVGQPIEWLLWVGVALSTLGMLVRLWASGYVMKNEVL